jgi:hypothetical protein
MFLITSHSLTRVVQFTGLGVKCWEHGSSFQSEYTDKKESTSSYVLADLSSVTQTPHANTNPIETIINLLESDEARYVFMVYDVETQDYLSNLGVAIDLILRVPPDTDRFDAYLSYLITVFETGATFDIGTHDSTARNAAGILPVLYHNSQLYAMLGLDSRVPHYSDFGGGFDRKYSPTSHKKRDSYKNAVLGTYQIQNGMVRQEMLIDHLLNLNSEDRQKFLTDLQSGEIGYGDLNTLYTAFREYVEETSGRNRSGRIYHPVDIDKVFRRLFIEKAYIRLKCEKTYGYDTYLLFFTIDDFTSRDRQRLMRQISLIRASHTIYLREMAKPNQKTERNPIKIPISVVSSPSQTTDSSGSAKKLNRTTRHSMSKTNGMPDIGIYQRLRNKDSNTGKIGNITYRNQNIDAGYSIYGNYEMRRIDLFPLFELAKLMEGVAYDRYNFFNNGWKKKRRRQEKEYKKPIDYHTQCYDAPIYDKMRPSFADAMVKYNHTLLTICRTFETYKTALL